MPREFFPEEEKFPNDMWVGRRFENKVYIPNPRIIERNKKSKCIPYYFFPSTNRVIRLSKY
jgi:hypothetical protein